MTWAVLALLTAFFESAKDVLGKKRLGAVHPVVLAWAWRAFALPILLPPLLLTGVPEIGDDFGWALAVSGSLNALASLLYMHAIRASDLSLTVPMVAFTPLFLLVTSPLVLGEIPAPAGMAGVVLIASGTYLLRVRERQKGWIAPLRALFREKGPRWMLLVALVWSVTANIDKVGVQASSPLFWSAAVHGWIAAVLLPFTLLRWRSAKEETPRIVRDLLPVGVSGALATLCQMTAITMALVPYVISLKRTSTILSVLWGHLFFREEGIRERMGGALLMLGGMVLILLA